ncbi:MAG: hypothetical protein OEM26_17525, partial [Saprospiraceae bacterium]|nr:hypothetical protein [Saprospiraceae bacterium]
MLILFSGYGQAQFQGFKSGLSLNLAPNDVSNSRYQIDYLTEKSGLIDDELVAIRARYQAHREETTVGYDRLDFSLHVHLEWLLNDRLSLVSGAILAFTERKTAFSFPQGSTRLVSYEVLEPGSVSSFGTARYSSIEDLARPSGNLVLHQKEKFYMLSLP